jgi:broad specificity phosphatase PhoE
MALTLLRHSALHPSLQRRFNGWTDIPPEPSLFKPENYEILHRISFDAVYTSDLIRCVRTLEMANITSYITDARLREVRFKAHIEGKTFRDVEKMKGYDDSLLNDPRSWHAFVCAESYEYFEKRIAAFLDSIDMCKEILVCTHGGVMATAMRLLGLPNTEPFEYGEFIRIEHGVCTLV